MSTTTLFILALLLGLIGLSLLYRRKRQQHAQALSQIARLERELQMGASNENQVSQRLAAVGVAASDALLICKTDRTVIYMNPVAHKLFTVPPDNQSLIAITRQYEIDQLFNDTTAEHGAEKQLFINNQTWRVRAVNFSGGMVIALTDITELQRLGRARRDFIANISHELRTPLTGIRLVLDTLKTPAGKNSEIASGLIEKIVVETEALTQLAQELLDLSSIESGQTVMKLSPTTLRPLALNVIHRMSEMAARKQQTVTAEIDESLLVLMDAAQIERVLLNLLHNALKFTPAKGVITLRAKPRDAKWVQVEVSDNGGGISQEDLPRIFERFYRGDRARSTQGTGLGLAVAKHIVEAHGGKIWAESTGLPGHGSTFGFTLPLPQ